MPSPSTTKKWRELGTDAEILLIVGMMFDIWPARRDASEIVPLIWLRGLRKYPLLSIYEAFVRLTENPQRWRPDPGTFTQAVRHHAEATKNAIFYASEKGPG